MSPMEYTVWMYLVYLNTSLALTVWVGRPLHKNGRVFLVHAFHGNEALADSVNHLRLVGFYLINIGYLARALKAEHRPFDLAGTIELFSAKIGLVLLVLGLMHFFNLFVFSRMRRRTLVRVPPPPVANRERPAPEQPAPAV